MSNFFSLAIQKKSLSIDLVCLVKQHPKEKQYLWFRQAPLNILEQVSTEPPALQSRV